MTCLLFLWYVVSAPAAQPLIVEVQETAGIRRFQYPLAVRLQWPQPVARDTEFRLLLDDQPVRAQFRPADQGLAVAGWWLDFPVNLLPYQTVAYRVEVGAASPAAPAPQRGQRLAESEALFQVINEPAIAWSIDRRLTGLLKSVRSGDLEYLRPESPGLQMIDHRGNSHAVGVARDGGQMTSHVLRSGPLAVGIRWEWMEEQPELAGVRSTVDLVFPVSKSWVEVDWRVEDPQGKLAGVGTELNMNLSEPTRDLPTLVDIGATSLVYVALSAGQDAVLQSVPRVAEPPSADVGPRPAWEVLRGPPEHLEPFVAGPSQSLGDSRPEGWVHVMDRQRCLALAVERFAQDARDRITVSAAGTVRLSREFPTSADGSPTGAKHLHFWLHFIPFPPQQTAATSPQSMQTPPAVRIRREE